MLPFSLGLCVAISYAAMDVSEHALILLREADLHLRLSFRLVIS